MKKQTGAVMLVAATCIGSGMIALPMLLAKIGIIPSILLMVFLWGVIYHTSLVNIELNLQAGEALSLGGLAKKFSGKFAEICGTGCFKILSYTLLAVYISAGSSVLHKMLESFYVHSIAYSEVIKIYTLGAALILLCPLKIIDFVNRILFMCLLSVVAVLVIGLCTTINWSNLPLFSNNYNEISNWKMIIPIVFTAFGFQVIFHTLTKFCNFNAAMLKKAFLWGSLVPVIVYILWTSALLASIYQNNPTFFAQMQNSTVAVGDLIKVLSEIAHWNLVQILIWWISLLAIITSVIGIGIGMEDSLAKMLPLTNTTIKKITSVFLTIVPPYMLATLIPNAFTKLLSFAGMILVIIAVILPIILFSKANFIKLNYSLLKQKLFIYISFLSGLVIIFCEISKYI